MTYATVSDVRSWLGIYDTADDTELQLALNAAEDAVSIYVGHDCDVYGNPSAKVFRATNRQLLDLGEQGLTIGSTNGLAIDVDDDDDGVFEVAWAATDWQVEPLNSIGPGGISWPGLRIRAVGDYRFPIGGSERARVQVTARWGWPAVPKQVKLATIMLTAAWHQRRATMTGRSGFEGFFQSAIRDDQAIADLLDAYRLGTAITGFA